MVTHLLATKPENELRRPVPLSTLNNGNVHFPRVFRSKAVASIIPRTNAMLQDTIQACLNFMIYYTAMETIKLDKSKAGMAFKLLMLQSEHYVIAAHKSTIVGEADRIDICKSAWMNTVFEYKINQLILRNDLQPIADYIEKLGSFTT
ncbi:hypothetical protein JTB14_023992 [Gonioctena quinquepunctata]|nr:hypothetical protein JTB14_023992 [Gonioctena quinquepunctata]